MRTSLIAVFTVGALVASAAAARADILSIEPDSINGWIDLRAVSVNGEQGWRDGGFGKLRYGKESRLEMAQAAVLWTPRLTDTVTGHVFLQAAPEDGGAGNVSEAYLHWKPVPSSDFRYSLRAGQMFPPVSLEHDGKGWTTTRTLTPSAINSWVAEELLVDGVEANVQKTLGGHRVGATLGLFMGGDTAGTLLTFRGWAQHDLVSGNGARLPLPVSTTGTGWPAVFTRQAAVSRPLIEVDGRAGQYLRLDWHPPLPFDGYLVVYDNPGKPTVVRHGQYAWNTRFTNLGLRGRVDEADEWLFQGLKGTTEMGAVFADGTHPADIAYESAYLLGSHSFPAGVRLSARLDYFAVSDHSLRAIDDNTEKSYTATLAWMRPVSQHIDLIVEAVRMISDRPSRTMQGLDPHQSQTQLQIALKLHL